jgi:pilus assembly protein FimV
MTQSIDGVEDLTRFADESFDTEGVDLFEFTGVDDSPLTRLKSIILSLDWEISDDILDELGEEVTNLQKMWEGDKVAQVYLQGIEKIGKYLRLEGAYAHVNAMKLLLTLFYNYEKIISSPNISGDEITTLVKSDIRKFKVLQYQIGQQSSTSPTVSAATSEPQVTTPIVQEEKENDILADLNATILELEWEVTEDGLDKFNDQTIILQEQLADDKSGLVLVNGLQALGAYIREQKVNAHPDSFTLLHSFFDGLKLLLSSKHMTEEKRQEILVDRVTKLNVLKEIIAGTAAAKATEVVAPDEVDQILDFEESEEIPQVDKTAVELPADIDEGVEDLFSSPVAGDDSEDFELDFDPDQSELDEEDDSNELDEDMVASLSSNDNHDDLTPGLSGDYVSAAMETSDEQYPADILDPDAIRPVSSVVADDLLKEELASSGSSASSLSESTLDDFSDFSLDDDALSSEELDDELELLLGRDEADSDKSLLNAESFDDLELNIEEETEDSSLTEDFTLEEDSDLSAASAETGDDSTAELEGQIDSLFGSAEDEPKEEDVLGDDFDSIIPALDDTDEEEAGFQEEVVAEGIAEDPTADLEGRLDSFFGLSEEEPDIEEEISPPADKNEGDIIPQDNAVAALSDADDDVVAALSDADDDVDGGFQIDEVVAELDEGPSDDLQNKLNSFFGGTEDDEDSAVPESAAGGSDEESFLSGIDDKLDNIFQETAVTAAVGGALGAVVAKLTGDKPSADELQQVAEVVAQEKENNPGSQKTVILTLIDTATDMLATSGSLAEDAGSTIIKELATDLEDADNPQTMVAAVERFTTWQKDLFAMALQQSPAAPQTNTNVDEEIAAQVKENFSQLRETLLNEFAEIKKELKK